MAEQTTNYIEIDGEGKYIEDTAAREGVSQNAVQINAIQEVIPSGTAANNKLVNINQLTTELAKKSNTLMVDVELVEVTWTNDAVQRWVCTPTITVPQGYKLLFYIAEIAWLNSLVYRNMVLARHIGTGVNADIAIYTDNLNGPECPLYVYKVLVKE